MTFRVVQDHQTFPPAGRPSAVAIGNFDGVHLGHRALLAAMLHHATATDTHPTVLTFAPHPARLLAPGLAPPLICEPADKRTLLARAGAMTVVEQRFDRAFAALPPEVFARVVLSESLGARHVVVGYDFTFGAQRAGDAQALAALGRAAPAPFSVEIVAARDAGGLVASSTRVREFVLEGRLEGARLLLDRPYHLSGQIVPGDRRGRSIGFPTANLQTESELLPRVGVYATWLDWGSGPHPSVSNVGYRPTFDAAPRLAIEAFVLDAPANLSIYGARAQLHFEARLRGERRFEGVDALRAQIERDVVAARGALADRPPPASLLPA